MSGHTIIVSGGSIQEEFALRFLRAAPYEELIGVDNGLAFLYRNQIRPTRIVGDFDTADPGTVAWYKSQKDIEVHTFNPVKDATDTQIALELALAIGSTSITILGGTGSRLDHTLGNIQTMALALEAGVNCQMLDEKNRIRLIREPVTIKREEQYGEFVSLLPLTTEAKGVSLRGFKYPLTDYTFTSTGSAGLGVSNEITEEEGHIMFTGGVLILIEARD